VSLSRGRKVSRLGRPSVIDEEKRNLILELYWSRNLGLRKIADFVGVSSMTVWREVSGVRM
jgi:DNA-directed RNA polymerase specialized sigma subunit